MAQLEVTDADLARARRDPAFKQQLLTSSLDRLLAVLYEQQHNCTEADPAQVGRLREGAQLAARLADIIRGIDGQRTAAQAKSRQP
jgi:hypothetical protein